MYSYKCSKKRDINIVESTTKIWKRVSEVININVTFWNSSIKKRHNTAEVPHAYFNRGYMLLN